MFSWCFRQTTRSSYDRNCRQPEARIGNVPWQEILWTQTLLCRKKLWEEIFRPCNKSDPWFGLKSLVILDPILLSPEPFPLSPDPSHILGFEPWAHIPCYDPATLARPASWDNTVKARQRQHAQALLTRTKWSVFSSYKRSQKLARLGGWPSLRHSFSPSMGSKQSLSSHVWNL